MTRGDQIPSRLFLHPLEKPIPEVACHFLDSPPRPGGFRCRIHSFHPEFRPVLSGLRSGEFLVAVRFRAPQPVVHMGNDQPQRSLASEQVEQHHGIHAAADPYDNSIALPEEAVDPAEFDEARSKCPHREHGGTIDRGSGRGIRTPDTRIMIPLLYRLSYPAKSY